MRACRECRECCIVMKVTEIDKPANQACKHLCARGCAIYAERPQECRTFDCFWLLGLVPSWMKPNKTHAVIWPGVMQGPKGKELSVIRVNFNAAFRRNARVLRWAKEKSHKFLVVLTHGTNVEYAWKGELTGGFREDDTMKFTVTDGRITDLQVEHA